MQVFFIIFLNFFYKRLIYAFYRIIFLVIFMALMLVTGASRGLGRAFAFLHARKKGDLILVSRSKDQLEALKKELQSKFGITVYVFVQDLSKPNAAIKLYTKIKNLDLIPDLVVNNAGIGCSGALENISCAELEQLLTLNITSLALLTRMFLGDMKQRGHGRILNVSSIAALIPGPYMSPYYASKAFVKSFSEALWQECRKSGVSVTVLLPGPLDTNFVKASRLQNSAISKLFTANPEKVAKKGYQAMLKGKRQIIAGMGPVLSLLMRMVPWLPQKIVLAVTAKLQEPQNK